MLSALSIDDRAASPVSLLVDGQRGVSRASGLSGIGTVRPVIRTRPTNHGSIDQSRWTEGSLVTLEGFALTLNDLRVIAKPFLETLDYGPALLKWTEQASGLQLQKRVRITGEFQQVYDAGVPNFVGWQAQLLASDPRAYSQTLTTATGLTLGFSAGGLTFNRTFNITFGGTAGGTVAVNNQGNRPSPPVFRVYGGCTNATIVLVGAGKQIALTGNIANGDYLEIDVQARTMKLNGTSTALFYLNPASTTWFELPTGTSTIQVTATAFDGTARCDVLYRSAYT